MSDRRDMLRTALAFAFVGMMLMIPVQVGYATAYTATTTSANNSISANYFTVNLYEKTDTNYGSDTNYVATSSIVNTSLNTIKYTKDPNNPTINRLDGSFNITKNNIFLRISETGYSGGTYIASASGTAIDGGGYDILTAGIVLLYEYGGMTTGSDPTPIWNQVNDENHPLLPNTYYMLKYYVDFDDVVIHGTPVNNNLSLSITPYMTVTETILMNGSYAPGTGSVTIGYSSNNDAQAVIAENDPSNLNGFDLIDASDSTNYSSGGQHCQAINIDNPNSSGITSGGRANVTVKIPANTKFIIAVDGGGGNPHNTIDISITGGGINKSYTGIKLKSDTYVKPSGETNSVPNPTPDSNWFVTTDSNGISIHFQSTNGNGGTDNAQVYIVLCPTT